MLWCLLGVARAFELGSAESSAAAGEVSAIAVGELDGDGAPDLALATTAGLELELSTSGALLVEIDAVDVSAGFLQAFACGPGGMWLVDPAGPPESLATDPCEAVEAVDLDGDGDDDLVLSATTLQAWEDEGGGSWAVSDHGLALAGAPLLAAGDALGWAAYTGGSALVSVDLDGISSSSAGGAMAGLAAVGEVVAWSLSETGEVVIQGEDPLAVGETVGLLAGAEGPLFAVVSGGDVVVVGGSPPAAIASASLPSADAATALAFADADGDDCPDVVLAQGAALAIYRGADCPEPTDDADGDGWTTAEGDCDDEDSAVHPGAAETCDGTDEDCDGALDEAAVSVEATVVEPGEGGTVEVRGAISGCATTWSWSWQGASEVATCAAEDLACSCEMIDEGAITVVLTARDGDSPTGRASIELFAGNLPPVIAGDAPREVAVYVDEEDADDLLVAFEATDPGNLDALAWSLSGEPDGMRISDGGIVTYHAEEAHLGEWRVVVRVEDDAGAADERTLFVSVEERSPDDELGLGCCCFGATAATAVPMWMLGAGLRRRGRWPPDPA